jgi:hypothetical protein
MRIEFDPDSLRPLVALVVSEAITQLRADEAMLDGKLCFGEEEAARLLGLNVHVLRDERRRGQITASRIVGRRIRYTKADLLGYLAAKRITQ